MKIKLNISGFTMIELLIVIAIMAILAASVLPNFIGLDKGARYATTKANLDALRGAINLYRYNTGSYPTDLSTLTSTSYSDSGATRYYMRAVPVELISSATGVTVESNSSSSVGSGWYYTSGSAEVKVSVSATLDSTWGTYSTQAPNSW